MVNDLGDTKIYQMTEQDGSVKENYQYGALIRLRILSTKIHRGFQQRYAMLTSFNQFVFEPAEIALEHESKLLFKKMVKKEIEKQYKKAPSRLIGRGF